MTQRGRAIRPTAPAGRSRRTDGPRGGDRAGASRGDLAARRDRLRAVIEPVVAGAGYDLEDVSVSRAGRRHVVRVIVDADGGINLDAVAVVSRAVSAALDAAEESGGDIVAGEYQLEVSSPGVDRPLTLPRHWRRNAGRLVKVTVRAGEPAVDRQVTGRVVAADDERVVLETESGPVEHRYAELGPGRVQVEFHRLDEIDEADEIDEVGDDTDEDDDDDVEDEER
ncbi:ribosome maturation factor RimP [Micromonospora sp. SCSIO 07396]